MDKNSERIVSFASSLEFRDLSPAVVRAIKLRFIDTVGCALGAFSAAPAVITRRLASGVQSASPAGVLGSHIKSSPDLAAFANGAMIRCLDFNDDYFGKDGPHPSDTIAAVLAAADSSHANGKLFITGIAVAYEILCNLVDAVSLREKGWDYVTYTAMSSAVGAGRVFNFSQEIMSHAMSLAMVSNCALGETRAGELSMWKGMASANACRNGVFACLLAREGVTGPPEPIEGKRGFWKLVTGPFDLSSIGMSPLRAEIVYLKNWPVLYSAQLAVQAALTLRNEVAPNDIESLVVESYGRLTTRSASEPEKAAPKTRETADHSVHFGVAAALLDADITLDTFESKRFLDPDVVELMAKIQLREDPEFTKEYPEVWNCRITAVTQSGKKHQVHATYPKGHPKNPMNDHEVEEKFLKLNGRILGDQRCRAFFDFAWHLEEVDDVGKVFDLIAI
jgi:2-methylcitrate dehydratase